jgi:hypothetical protein
VGGRLQQQPWPLTGCDLGFGACSRTLLDKIYLRLADSDGSLIIGCLNSERGDLGEMGEMGRDILVPPRNKALNAYA